MYNCSKKPTPAFTSFSLVQEKEKHFIVTFHYHGVVLSLIPAIQPGGSRTAGMSDSGREEASRL